MSISNWSSFKDAVYARLTSQLAGQGPGSANVVVYDHPPKDPARVHCRIDGFNVVQRLNKSDKTSYGFTVHIFDRPNDSDITARGQKTALELQQTVVASLHDWSSGATGASAVQHEASDIGLDEDGLTQHAFSRFSVYVSAS